MKPELQPSSGAGDRLHERARLLAAEAVDADIEPMDAAWLDEHLASCPECSAISDEYRAQHSELRSLEVPEPPRDLWARTSAALDAVEARGSARKRTRPSGSRAGNRPLFGTAIAVGFAILVAGASLLAQSPIASVVRGSASPGQVALATDSLAPASQSPHGPLAVVNGTSYWIASDQGVYQIMGSSTDCAQTSGSCTVTGGPGEALGSIASDTSVSAVLAPDASQAVVWTADKIAIVSLGATLETVPLDLLTPRPTLAATVTPVAATPSPASSIAASELPSATISMAPASIATLVATATAVATVTPTAAATGGAVVSRPTAILDGYEIVGRDPEFSADGSLVAFSARPVDHATGPDVFIWRSGQEQARAVTSRHADLFAGWFGRKVLVSEIAAGTGAAAASGGADKIGTTSYLFDPADGRAQRIDRPMLVAGVDPTGLYLIYWSGSVEFDTVSGLWQPGKGDLYFDRWADLTLEPASLTPAPSASPESTPTESATPSLSPSPSPSPSPTAPPATAATETQSAEPEASGSPEPSATAVINAKTPEPTQSALPQRLPAAGAPASVRRWVVRWDAAGQNVAIWVADPGSVKIGRLSVFSIDRSSGLLSPKIAADEVLSTIGFDHSNLVYTSAMDGKTYLKPVPVIPPSSVSTPTPTPPGGAPASAGSSGVPEVATDPPGS